jgi:hypothetical protein
VPGGSRASCASGTILLHDEDLFAVLDEWVADIPAGAIEAVLPLLRRTISSFPPPERRAIGERVSAGRRRHDGAGTHELDEARADLVLPILARILGVPQAQS